MSSRTQVPALVRPVPMWCSGPPVRKVMLPILLILCNDRQAERHAGETAAEGWHGWWRWMVTVLRSQSVLPGHHPLEATVAPEPRRRVMPSSVTRHLPCVVPV